MSVQNGGIGGFVERQLLSAYFGAYALTPPSSVFVGFATSSPIDVSNSGGAVIYSADTVVDTTDRFSGLALAGAWVQTSSGKTGIVESNSSSTITLTGDWTGGTPAAGELYDVALFNEPSAGFGYARFNLTNNTSNFVELPAPPLSGAIQQMSPASAINFPQATGAGWGLVTFVFLADTATVGQGHLLVADEIAAGGVVVNNSVVASIPSGAFLIGLN